MCRIAFALFVAFAVAAPARAIDDLLKQLDLVAADVAKFLGEQGESKAVLTVNGPPTFRSAGGGALVQLFGEKLKAHRVQPADQAKYGVGLSFTLERSALAIALQIVDKRGKPAASVDYAITVRDPRRVGELIGLTVDIPKPDDFLGVDTGIEQAFDKPDATIVAGSKVKPGPNSPFAVQVSVGGAARVARSKDGLAFVDLDEKEEYRVTLINGSPFEVAVALAVDGLNDFHFLSERKPDGSPRYSYHIVGPGRSETIDGWQIDAATKKGFRVTAAEDSLAAKLGMTDKIGMVTATFHASWSQGQRSPGGEPDTTGQTLPAGIPYSEQVMAGPDGRKVKQFWPRLMVGAAPGAVGTGFGQQFGSPIQGTNRVIGAGRGIVTVRYQRPEK